MTQSSTQSDAEHTITVNRQHFLALLKAACHVNVDSEMALSGKWDRSDCGFQTQGWLLTDAIMPFDDLVPLSGFVPPEDEEDDEY